MIYKLITQQDPFELNPGLRAVEKYSKLTDRQMFFVCLVCDPSRDNPIRTLTGRERREKAAQLSGYKFEADGKRLDKNGRDVVDGKIASIEAAIEEFKKLHYNEREKNKEALRKQIAEIRDFLSSDKKIPVTNNKGIMLDSKGEEIWAVDQKGLKLAAELGERLPNLEEALNKLEALDPQETKFEGTTYTSNDLTPEVLEGNEELNLIDQFHLTSQKKD